MNDYSYRVKIVVGDRQIEFEGDKNFVLDMLNRYENIAKAQVSGRKSKKQETNIIDNEKDLSVREFIKILGFKKHTDITLGFGYYLEHYRGLKEFTPADINNCYYEAKLEKSNTSQMIAQNIKKGYIMQSKIKDGKGKAQKRYTLTMTGENYIKNKIENK